MSKDSLQQRQLTQIILDLNAVKPSFGGFNLPLQENQNLRAYVQSVATTSSLRARDVARRVLPELAGPISQQDLNDLLKQARLHLLETIDANRLKWLAADVMLDYEPFKHLSGRQCARQANRRSLAKLADFLLLSTDGGVRAVLSLLFQADALELLETLAINDYWWLRLGLSTGHFPVDAENLHVGMYFLRQDYGLVTENHACATTSEAIMYSRGLRLLQEGGGTVDNPIMFTGSPREYVPRFSLHGSSPMFETSDRRMPKAGSMSFLEACNAVIHWSFEADAYGGTGDICHVPTAMVTKDLTVCHPDRAAWRKAA